MAHVQELHVTADFDALLTASHTEPVALLKHSTACPISTRGQKQFLQLNEDGDPPLYMVVVQHSRALSNHIAETLDVRHESPQALIIAGGKVVYHASHYDISTEALRSAAEQARPAA